MISQCANPACNKPLHYLRDGKVWLLEMPQSDSKVSVRREHFWLCGNCAPQFELRQMSGHVEVVRRTHFAMPMAS